MAEQDQGSVTEQLVELQGYARHRGMHDAYDWIQVRREPATSPDREHDLQDLRGMLGSRHIARCGGCDRYKFEVEVCPHCEDQDVDTLRGRYAPGAIGTQRSVEVEPDVLRQWAESPMSSETFRTEFAEAIIDSNLCVVDVQVGRSDGPYVLGIVQHLGISRIFDARVPTLPNNPWNKKTLDELVRRILARFEELK